MIINIKVKPNSKVDQVVRQADGGFLIKTKAPAKEGKANEAVIGLLAKEFKVAKSMVKLLRGKKGRSKVAEIID
jgi:uncharacterized protein